jgi:hypothetical protein
MMSAQGDEASTGMPKEAAAAPASAAANGQKIPAACGERPAVPPASKMLRKDDIRTGMNMAQTVYAVLMTLGLKVAAEALYPAIFAPGRAGDAAFSPVVISLVFISVLFLAIRFFWVPRNLYEYVHYYIGSRETNDLKPIFRSLMLIHFPIAFIHTLLFFGICEAFAEMAKGGSHAAPAIHFVWIVIALLGLNAAWLFFGIPSGGSGRKIWATNNLIFAGLAVVALAGFYLIGFSTLALLVAAVSIIIVNSFVDLASAAENYILFD